MKNIILEINGNKFTFKPTPRTFEKAQAPFAVYNSASSDRANSIKIGTSTGMQIIIIIIVKRWYQPWTNRNSKW